MFRPEKGLGDWLAHSGEKPAERTIRVRLADLLQIWIRIPGLGTRIYSVTLDWPQPTRSAAEHFNISSAIHDGAHFIPAYTPVYITALTQNLGRVQLMHDLSACEKQVQKLFPRISGHRLIWPNSINVCPLGPIRLPRIQTRAVGKILARVRAARLLDNETVCKKGPWRFPEPVKVIAGMEKARKFPFVRSSAEIDRLNSEDSAKWVREVEEMKGLEPGRAELLGIFPKIPIEMVVAMRLMASKKLLLFTVNPDANLTRTRLHDVVAVRDRFTGETWILPHRTRYQTAFLG
jgi:hypothetical protein